MDKGIDDILSGILIDESPALSPDPIGLNLLETDYRTDELDRQKTEEFESTQISNLIDNNPYDDETTTMDNYDGPLYEPTEDPSGADRPEEEHGPVCGLHRETKQSL